MESAGKPAAVSDALGDLDHPGGKLKNETDGKDKLESASPPERTAWVDVDELEAEPPPVVSRKVSFADAFGLNLVSVKEYDSWPVADSSADAPKEEAASDPEEYCISCVTALPSSPEELKRKLADKCVELEEIELLPGTTQLRGTIRVLNLCFDKTVYVRTTLDSWSTYFDLLAEYIPGSSDGETDGFLFRVTLVPPFERDGARIEFCIRYETPLGVFWTNNGGLNYVVVCNKKECREAKERHFEESNQRNKRSCLKLTSKDSFPEAHLAGAPVEGADKRKNQMESVLPKTFEKHEPSSEGNNQSALMDSTWHPGRRSRRRAARLARVRNRLSQREVKPSDETIGLTCASQEVHQLLISGELSGVQGAPHTLSEKTQPRDPWESFFAADDTVYATALEMIDPSTGFWDSGRSMYKKSNSKSDSMVLIDDNGQTMEKEGHQQAAKALVVGEGFEDHVSQLGSLTIVAEASVHNMDAGTSESPHESAELPLQGGETSPTCEHGSSNDLKLSKQTIRDGGSLGDGSSVDWKEENNDGLLLHELQSSSLGAETSRDGQQENSGAVGQPDVYNDSMSPGLLTDGDWEEATYNGMMQTQVVLPQDLQIVQLEVSTEMSRWVDAKIHDDNIEARGVLAKDTQNVRKEGSADWERVTCGEMNRGQESSDNQSLGVEASSNGETESCGTFKDNILQMGTPLEQLSLPIHLAKKRAHGIREGRNGLESDVKAIPGETSRHTEVADTIKVLDINRDGISAAPRNAGSERCTRKPEMDNTPSGGFRQNEMPAMKTVQDLDDRDRLSARVESQDKMELKASESERERGQPNELWGIQYSNEEAFGIGDCVGFAKESVERFDVGKEVLDKVLNKKDADKNYHVEQPDFEPIRLLSKGSAKPVKTPAILHMLLAQSPEDTDTTVQNNSPQDPHELPGEPVPFVAKAETAVSSYSSHWNRLHSPDHISAAVLYGLLFAVVCLFCVAYQYWFFLCFALYLFSCCCFYRQGGQQHLQENEKFNCKLK